MRSALSFEEMGVASRERWLVPTVEVPGFFERGPSTAIKAMEDFQGTGPNPIYPSTNPNPNKDEPRDVGSDVEVVDQGKTFKGKVKEVNPDGTYTVSFDGARPSRDKFRKQELGKVGDKPQSLNAPTNSSRY